MKYSALILCFILVSCSAFRPVNSASPGHSLPRPGSIATRVASAVTASVPGSQFLVSSSNVAVAGENAYFDLPYIPDEQCMGWAVYSFTLSGYEQGRFLETDWSVSPEIDNLLWIGLGNRVTDRWDWRQAAHDERMLVDDVAPYLNSEDVLVVAVVNLFSGAYMLNTVSITGQPLVASGASPQVLFPGKQEDIFPVVSGSEPMSYEWDFGGGAIPGASTDEIPTVTAVGEGEYTGHLTVTSILGSSTVEFILRVHDYSLDLAEGQIIAVPRQSVA